MAAIAMVVVAAVALSSSTYAWFASNSKVTAEGITVSAKTEAGLIISNKKPTQNGNTTPGITVNLAGGDAVSLFPATHDEDPKYAATNLKYNEFPDYIDQSTGMIKADLQDDKGQAITELSYKPVEANAASNYYREYVVYISAQNGSMTLSSLKADLSSAVTDLTEVQSATSVDFYVNDTYKGTLNLKGVKNGTGDFTEVELLEGSQVIPEYKNTDDNSCLTVKMRVYVDGELKATDSKYFINSKDAVSMEGTTFTVNFSATRATN